MDVWSAKAGITAERHTCELGRWHTRCALSRARLGRIVFSLDRRLTWMSGSPDHGFFGAFRDNRVPDMC